MEYCNIISLPARFTHILEVVSRGISCFGRTNISESCVEMTGDTFFFYFTCKLFLLKRALIKKKRRIRQTRVTMFSPLHHDIMESLVN